MHACAHFPKQIDNRANRTAVFSIGGRHTQIETYRCSCLEEEGNYYTVVQCDRANINTCHRIVLEIIGKMAKT